MLVTANKLYFFSWVVTVGQSEDGQGRGIKDIYFESFIWWCSSECFNDLHRTKHHISITKIGRFKITVEKDHSFQKYRSTGKLSRVDW